MVSTLIAAASMTACSSQPSETTTAETTAAESTPYMDEASLCDRIALILDGKIIDQGTPQEIVSRYPAPFAPRNPKISPLKTWKEMLLTAVKSPNLLTRSRTSIDLMSLSMIMKVL